MDIVQTTTLREGHVIEYYSQDGEMRVRETCNGHVLDLSLNEYMAAPAWELTKYFALGPHRSALQPGPTNLGSP